MKNLSRTLFIGIILGAPTLVFGAGLATGGFKGFIAGVGGLVSRSVLIVFTLAVFAFFWGLTKYLFSSGDKKNYAEAINIMKWGILALFIMSTIWGIVAFLQRSFGLPQSSASISTDTSATDTPCSNFNPDTGGPCPN